MFAQVRDGRAHGNFGNGLELGEIEYGNRAVIGGDVGVHVEIGTQEGRAMLAKNDDGGGDEEQEKREIEAWIFRVGHGMEKG